MSSKEIGETLRFAKMGETVSRCLEQFPVLDLEVQVSPITKSVLRITLFVTPNFKWNDRVHGSSEPFCKKKGGG